MKTLRLALAFVFATATCAVARADNIVQTAQSAGQFTTLLAAAKAAGLVDALSAPGQLTVFAPTDAAFKRLPSGTVEALLKPENREQLKTILTYHVVPRAIESSAVTRKPRQVATLDPGASLKLQKGKGFVHVNGVRVIKADIRTDNGIIHVIDKVLIPKAAGT